MEAGAALFLFLAAAVVAVFAFLSIVVWVTAPAKERHMRDRYALLKLVAEQPGENAARVLEAFQQDEKARAARVARDERAGWIQGGVIVMAVGAGLTGMLTIEGSRGDWSVGLIPLFVGAALVLVGFFKATRQ